MLRRLPETHKQNALQIFNRKKEQNNHVEYDALYDLPHADGEKPPWPDHNMIEKCQKLK